MDKVAHFEIPADDLNRAQNFYGTAFGWEFMSPPGIQYLLVQTTESDQRGPKAPGAINGGILARKAPVTSPVITINVENIDEAISRVEHAGGKVVHAKFAVGNFGFSAYIEDTEGNVLGIWQSAHPC